MISSRRTGKKSAATPRPGADPARQGQGLGSELRALAEGSHQVTHRMWTHPAATSMAATKQTAATQANWDLAPSSQSCL